MSHDLQQPAIVVLMARSPGGRAGFSIEWSGVSASGSEWLACDIDSGTFARGRAGQVNALGPREPHGDAERMLRIQRPLVASECHVRGCQLLRDDLRLPLCLIA